MAAAPFAPKPGGCLCGAVRYELVADPVMFYACHCTNCQTGTGSSFALSMIVPREAIVPREGTATLRVRTFGDGREHHAMICPTCDVQLWGILRDFPDLLNLEAGTLDDTKWLVPAGHIWTRSAQPWVTLPNDVSHYEKQPTPEELLDLARAWKNRATA